MFSIRPVTLVPNPVCQLVGDNIVAQDFQYYDKDGFELNLAEQKFYRAMQFPIHNPILNHTCWQEPWFQLDSSVENLILDHSIFLCRAAYADAAYEYLEILKCTHPLADYLLKTKIKWGYDFALDAVRDTQTFEVLHVEYDHTIFENFKNHMTDFSNKVTQLDWQDAATRIWSNRDKWQYLKGFDQNHWKAEYLLGWTKSEYTEKSI